MSSIDPSVSIDARQRFLQALRRVLRPIVRLMVKRGIRYYEFVEVARTAYVESAVRDGVGGIDRPSLEQIAWATGIDEARIDHYIDLGNVLPTPSPVSKSTQIMTQVLHKWHIESRYLGTYGTPLELRMTDPPEGPNLWRLVKEVSANADPEAILDGLLEAKSVTRSDEGRIRPLTRAFIWPQGSITSIDYFGVTLARMTETLEHNLNSPGSETKRLERSVFADHGLPSNLLSAFHAFATERANQFLGELDDWLGQHGASDMEQAGSREEAGVNLFFYVEQAADQNPLTELVQPQRHTFS
ncbi:MAG: DUF6502 family protein [Steroidobacteraceae bacterium]